MSIVAYGLEDASIILDKSKPTKQLKRATNQNVPVPLSRHPASVNMSPSSKCELKVDEEEPIHRKHHKKKYHYQHEPSTDTETALIIELCCDNWTMPNQQYLAPWAMGKSRPPAKDTKLCAQTTYCCR